MILPELIEELRNFDIAMHPDTGHKDYYDYELRDSKKILVCIGDSWTRGNGLGPLQHTDVFGAQASLKLKWDWLNIGGDGLSNSWMINNLDFIIPSMNSSKYEGGTIVITFAENGRDVADYGSRKFDYISTYSGSVIDTEFYNKILDDIELEWVTRLKKARQHLDTRFNLLIGSHWAKHSNLLGELLQHVPGITWINERWIDIMAQSINKEPAPDCRLISVTNLEIINNLLQIKNTDCYKTWFIETSTPILKVVAWLENTREYFDRHDTEHPNSKGHEVWSNVVVSKCSLSRF
jgi:hypothetical protein